MHVLIDLFWRGVRKTANRLENEVALRCRAIAVCVELGFCVDHQTARITPGAGALTGGW